MATKLPKPNCALRHLLAAQSYVCNSSSPSCVSHFRTTSPSQPVRSAPGVSLVFHNSVLSNSSLSFFSSAASKLPNPPQVPPPPSHQHHVNPPETVNPDPVTLKEQWRYATRMYSMWYAHAWGTAIVAGLSFYAVGWLVKGENPLSSGVKENKEVETG